ncbi:MAG: hypothetical protein ABJD24_06425 [Acidimicrobiales bacterium]
MPAVAAPAWAGGKAEYCYTTLLSSAELESGKVSVISCYSSESLLTVAVELKLAPFDTLGFLPLSFTNRRLARHYDSGTSGSNLSVYGTGCTGGGLNLTGTGWEDRISTTQHGACGAIVHYTDVNFGGSAQTTFGGCGAWAPLNFPLTNNVSSIRYYGPESGWCAI